MNKVAKLVIIDKDDKYLMMYRSGHPVFGNDPDLPGGTLEYGEEPIEAMIREVYEEAGIEVDKTKAQLIYEGVDYSRHSTQYSLYKVKLNNRPTIRISWEHSNYEWIDRNDFLEKAKNANDTFMQMTYDKLK